MCISCLCGLLKKHGEVKTIYYKCLLLRQQLVHIRKDVFAPTHTKIHNNYFSWPLINSDLSREYMLNELIISLVYQITSSQLGEIRSGETIECLAFLLEKLVQINFPVTLIINKSIQCSVAEMTIFKFDSKVNVLAVPFINLPFSKTKELLWQ